MKIPFARVYCSGNERKYLQEVLDSGWLTTASKVASFEKKFSEYVGATYCCAVNSCTAALHLALDAIDIKPGDKVIVPSLTFTSSAEVIRYMGADPIFVDCDYNTKLVTPEIVEEAIKSNKNIKAIIVVHYGGQSAQMFDADNKKGIVSICRSHGIKIIEDAAHAFPTKHHGQYIGTIGDITCFSFYANKTITTGEGGMIATESKDIYERIKMMRLHGINRDIWDRFTSDKPKWEYDVLAPGYKYNMPDINAAVGLAQLERAEELRCGRQKCAEFYYENLSNIDCIDLPVTTCDFDEHSWHLFPIVLNEKSPVSRNKFIELMMENGVGMSVHYKPLHRLTYYREKYNIDDALFPNTEKIWNGTASLPIYLGLSDKELKYVVQTIRSILDY